MTVVSVLLLNVILRWFIEILFQVPVDCNRFSLSKFSDIWIEGNSFVKIVNSDISTEL